MKKFASILLLALALFAPPAKSQIAVPGLPLVPLGSCQLSASQLASAIGLSACVRASFTGTGSGKNLTVSSVSGVIKAGDQLNGTGVPAGTIILSQESGTVGGAGVYATSNATTSSTASLTSGGIPIGALYAFLQAETASVRYRDDGGVPTSAVGSLVVFGIPGIFYPGSAGGLAALSFIAASGSPLLDVAFYR